MSDPLTAALCGRIRDRAVLAAMRRVAREKFLDDSLASRALDDSALPIGFSQTTSQPFVIARMLEMMRQDAACKKVLEVGGGCGYQSAVLAELCESVTVVERLRPLVRAASRRLRTMQYDNIQVVHADGFLGYAAAAPFDGIVVCAEHREIPRRLVEQLHPKGRLVMPLKIDGAARLVAVNSDGAIVARREGVSFVPLKTGVA